MVFIVEERNIVVVLLMIKAGYSWFSRCGIAKV